MIAFYMDLIAQALDADGPTLDRALLVVRDFVAEKKRVLYGGLAIDYALRLKGSHIYPDGERPDFDFYSPEHAADAYELAVRFHELGFPNVSAIRATHVQTMRVRIDFVPVADISFIPATIAAGFPTVEYAGIRVLHPHWQALDQHLAFCYPFNNAPREDLFHRFRKDHERFNLLRAAFPLPAAPPVAFSGETVIEFAPRTCALHGFAAHALATHALADLQAALCGKPAPPPWAAAGSRIRLTLPGSGWPAADFVAHQKTAADVAAGALLSKRRGFLEFMPPREEYAAAPGGGPPICIHLLPPRGLAAATVYDTPAGPIKMCSLQYVAIFFLLGWQRGGPEAARSLAFYHDTLRLMAEGESALQLMSAELETAEFERIATATPFCLTVDTFDPPGESFSESRLLQVAGDITQTRMRPPAELELADGRTLVPSMAGTPTNYYQARGRPPPPFDIERALHFFGLDGEKESIPAT